MTTAQASVTYKGIEYAASLEPWGGGQLRVEICHDGHWVGRGKWEDDQITDCDARLGSCVDETEEIYEALDEALSDALADGS